MASSITLDDRRAADGYREATLHTSKGTTSLYFRCHDRALPEGDASPFLLGSLLHFMEAGEALHLAGRTDRRLLSNLEEWQRAWTRWYPDRYRRVAITADEVVDADPVNTRGICAYSGGVDAAFTAHRHSSGGLDWSKVDVQGALLVQGFDIPLSENDTFSRAKARAIRSLEGTGIALHHLETNFMSVGQRWEDAFGAAVAAALSNFSDLFGVGLIGSSEAYDGLVLPWGSSPVTDPLLSSGSMTIRHDGAWASRTDKVAALAEMPAVVPHLRFCWQGPQQDRNCGRCEKCLRTACNFYAAGVEAPACFDRPPTPSAIRRMKVRNTAQLAEMRSIIEYARARGIAGPWLDALNAAYRRQTVSLFVRDRSGWTQFDQRVRTMVHERRTAAGEPDVE